MPGSKRRKSRKTSSARNSAVLDQVRPGMPAKDSVREVMNFVSPQNVRYKILRTSEMDAYDPAPKAEKKRASKS